MLTGTVWKWAAVVGLSMTPALLLGQTASAAEGISAGFDPRILIPVMAVGGFVEGMIVAWLGGTSERIGAVHRFCVRLRRPKAVSFAQKWGCWGGMFIGVAIFGQEPILLALRFLGVEQKKLVAPTALSNAFFAAASYFIVKVGMEKVGQI